MRLPDPRRSNVVLVGTGSYRHPDLPDLPAVRNNTADLAALLTDRRDGSFLAGRCRVLDDPQGTVGVFRALREHAAAAEDTLVLYFAGHGLVNSRLDLYLSMADTVPDELAVTALSFDIIRDLLRDSPATNKVVILDCCFSGRAIQGMSGGDPAAAEHLAVEGSYVLTATTANRQALAPPGARHTRFTGELIRILRHGLPDGPPLLTLQAVYRHLLHSSRRDGFPQPAQRGTGTADRLALARNLWSAETPYPAQPAKPAAQPVRTAAEPAGRAGQAAAPATAAPRSATKPAAGSAPARQGYVPVPKLLFGGDGATLLTSGSDRAVRVWDVSTCRLERRLEQHGDILAGMAAQPGGALLATASYDKTLRLWAPGTGRLVWQVPGVSPRWVAFSPDGHLLATTSKEPDVSLWDVSSGRRAGRLDGHQDDAMRVSFTADGSRILTTARDGTLRVWDRATLRTTLVLDGIESPAQSALHCRVGWLATAMPRGAIRLRSILTGVTVFDLPRTGGRVRLLVMSGDGMLLASVTHDDVLRLWDLQRRQVSWTAPHPAARISHVTFGPARRLATVTDDGRVHVRDTRTGEVVRSLGDDPGTAPRFLFSPDGNLAATGNGAGEIRLWDLRSDGGPTLLDGRAAPSAAAPADRPAPAATGEPHRTRAWLRQVLRGPRAGA